MPGYDGTLFSPPAPLAAVSLRIQDTNEIVPGVLMLIDSGADVTLLPSESVNRLGVSIDADAVYELMGFDGSRSAVPAAYLDLIFEKQVFRGRFLVVDQAIGIIGRDILNHVSILLDGPHLIWRRVSG
jgi:hypothetical protein